MGGRDWLLTKVTEIAYRSTEVDRDNFAKESSHFWEINLQSSAVQINFLLSPFIYGLDPKFFKNRTVVLMYIVR